MKQCPFCGSHDVDAEFWSRDAGVSVPRCMTCGATAESVEDWNRRYATIVLPAAAVRQTIDAIGTMTVKGDTSERLQKTR